MVYVLFSGVRGRSDRKTGAAAVVVAGETLIFAANGLHCPLTAVAQDLGDRPRLRSRDIYLPHWFARNLPGIHVPLILVGRAAALADLAESTAVRDSQRRLLLGR